LIFPKPGPGINIWKKWLILTPGFFFSFAVYPVFDQGLFR
jgi:hypothetical protein